MLAGIRSRPTYSRPKEAVRGLTHRPGAAFAATAIAFAALLVSGAQARPITGELSQPDYSVIAVAADGEGVVAKANPTFSLRAPAKTVTLQLRGKDGTYSGPIVVGRGKGGKRAILGVEAGAKLGPVQLGDADGYAVARPGDKWIDPKRWARARDGVPIGNGRNFGFVRSKHTDGGVEGDHDLDGVPNLLDVDANGNKILDRYEHPSTGKAAPVSAAQEPSNPAGVKMTPGLILTLKDSLNADAMPDLKLADVDSTLANFGFFWIVGDPGDTTVELDCGGSPDPNDASGWIGGLRYCTRGGTGRVAASYTDSRASAPRSWPLAFPDCCDTDGNGFGELDSFVSGAHHVNAYLSHGATTAEVGTGDVLNWKVTSDGVTTDYPTSLEDVFATDPALASYDDGTGAHDVSYPVLPPYTGSPPSVWGGDSETHAGFPVSACPADAPPPCVPGHVVLTFTFWRPQRPAIGSESGDFADIGNSVYSTAVSWPNHPCPQGTISTDDPSLTPAPGMGVSGGGEGGGGFRDPAPDQPPDPDNTLSFSVDATECLDGEAWNEGGSKLIWLASTSERGVGAGQELYFTLTG